MEIILCVMGRGRGGGMQTISNCIFYSSETRGANGDMKLARPAQDLFLYAVLRNQQDLAKLFWREGNVRAIDYVSLFFVLAVVFNQHYLAKLM